MRKDLKIVLIILGVILGVLVTTIIIDTAQALIFNKSPLVKIREYTCKNDPTYYIDKGLFVNHYHCSNVKVTLFKWGKSECNVCYDNNAKEELDKDLTDSLNKKVIQCLESELGAYIVGEQDDLVGIPLSEIKNNDKEKMTYYKINYASQHPNYMYVIVVEKNKVFSTEVLKDFEKYFYQRYAIYQKAEIASEGISIYIHSPNNDVNFKEVINKCVARNNFGDVKVFPSKIMDNLKDTKKIIIKNGQKELGTITDENKLKEILNAVSRSKQYGDNCLADGHSFDFEMYNNNNNNNELIETIYIWQDGKRLATKDMGCYYNVKSNDFDFRKIIEEETDYVFYYILDYRDDDNQYLQLIYKDNEYEYHLKSNDINEILIQFGVNNQVMTLKYALENKYISAKKVANEYPEILIKK